MTATFWIIIGLMLVLAVAIVTVPLWWRSRRIDDDHKQRNIAIARQRLAELDAQKNSGVLSEAAFDECYRELKVLLSDDLAAEPAEVTSAATQGRWIAPLLMTAIPVLSLYLYFTLGDANAQRKLAAQQTAEQGAQDIEAMLGKLVAKLERNPDDTEGWLMLGRAYSYLQRHDQAAQAFAELYKRKPDDVEALLQYANSLALARDGRVSGEPEQLVEQVLRKEPANANALWLAGMARMEQGRLDEAAALWHQLVPLLPPDSESLQQVQAMLQSLEQQMAATSSAAAPLRISVKVDVVPAAKSRADAAQTVFIYAQAIDGPKMPLAIVRKQLADLPVEVVLDDTAAMQPGTRLADFPRLRIVARLSQSGQAMPAAGDWLGSVEIERPLGSHPVTVLIDQEIK